MARLAQQFRNDFTNLRNSPTWNDLSKEEQQDITQKAKLLLQALHERDSFPEMNEAQAIAETEQQFLEKNRADQGAFERYVTAPLYRGASNLGANAAKLAAFGLDVVGEDDAADEMRKDATERQQVANETAPGLGKSYSELTAGDVPQFITDVVGENLPTMLTTGLAGRAISGSKLLAGLLPQSGRAAAILTPEAVGGAAATYGLMSLPEVYTSVKEAGGGAGSAALFAAPHAIIENLGGITPTNVASWFKRGAAKEIASKGLKNFLFDTFKGVLGEGSEEVAQGMVEMAARHFSTKPYDQAVKDFAEEVTSPEAIEQMKTEFAGGAAFGVAGGGVGAVQRYADIQQKRQAIAQRKGGREFIAKVTKVFNADTSLSEQMTELKKMYAQETEPGRKEHIMQAMQQLQRAKRGAPSILEPSEQAQNEILTNLRAPMMRKQAEDAQGMAQNQAFAQSFIEPAPETGTIADYLKYQAEKQQPVPQQPVEGRQLPDGGIVKESKNDDIITLKSGEPFKSQKAAQGYQAKNNLKASHDIVATRGGFVLMKKAAQQQAKRITVETPRGGDYNELNVRTEKNIPTENRTRFTGTPGAAERIEKRLTPQAIATEEFADQTTIKQPEPVVELKAEAIQPKPAEPVKQSVTKSVYKVESYQGGFRVLDPEGKQYSWHTGKQAADDKAAELNNKAVNIPPVLYHGTDSNFSEFDPAKGSNGFWFSENPSDAVDYGNNVLQASITIQNPAYFKRTNGDKGVNEAIAKAKADGYDGLIITSPEDGDESGMFWPTNYVAFYPEQIKLIEKKGESEEVIKAPATESQKSEYTEQTRTIAEIVQTKFAAGEGLKITDLINYANEVFGGTQADGVWNIKDLYDSMELGINLYLLNNQEMVNLFNSGDIKAFVEKVKTEILAKIPTQTRRTEEMDEFQQFSTPPSIASMAAWLANINKNDSVLEPSAGIGGLAVFGKMAGAKVVVNELSQRRAEILSNLPFDQFFTENGEQINNILPDDVAPTVVVMNPPFSSTAGRVKGERKTKNGGVHVEQALKRLRPGGRLVAIVGQGMSFEHSTFRDWWNKIKSEYNVLANVGLSGQEYKKYGTTFDNRILVIDKTGATTGQPVSGDYNNIESMIDALQGVINVRQAIHGRAETGKSNADKPQSRGNAETDKKRNGGRPSDGSSIRTSEGNAVIENISKEHDDFKADKRSGLPGNVGTNGDISTAENNADPRPDASIQGRRESSNESGDTGRHDALSSGQSLQLDGSEKLEVTQSEQVKSEDLSDSIYDEYRPSVTVQGAKKHPGKLVESAAMAAVSPAKVNYTPKIPSEAVRAGKISDAQLEAVIRAGNNHSQKLIDGKRKGFFIGDGTGVGKGREISAVFWDNFLQGRKKGVWVTKNSDLFKDARRDIDGIGWDKSVTFELKDYDDIKQTEGILLVSYDTIKGKSKDGRTRLEQINSWLGENFDGVIAFDEAHMMANSVTTQSSRGKQKPSERALKGFDFRQTNPDARVLYVSATGATEPSNLGYLERLGLWGPGTPFGSVDAFIAEVTSGGVAAMEMIAADMKAMGNYIARSLSFDGVTYGRLSHELTPEQQKVYGTYCTAWQTVMRNIEEALEVSGGKNSGQARAAALSAFWSANQRFFNQVLTSLQMPTLLKDIEQQLKDGKSVILQLTNTNEAQLKRQLDTLEDGALEDLDLTPTEIISQFVESSFPVAQMEQYTDENGNIRYRVVVDSNGNVVLNKDAVALRDRLLDELGSIRRIDGPLDMIINHFGPDAVAEITGRTTRVVWRDGEDGSKVRVKENRSKRHSEAEENDFMSGKKRILVFSEAGGTGRSFHADLSKKNQQHRIHYLVQAGWKADSAIQGLGRSHRTNEASQPHYVLCSTNVPAQVRFTSTIARRLDQLGALTRGQRQTGSQGIFQAKDNLENEYAEQAVHGFIRDLARQGSIGGLTFSEFELQSGLKLRNQFGSVDATAVEEIPVRQFLNRTLSFDLPTQELVYSEVFTRLDELVQIAESNGTLDVGMETIRAKSIVEKRGEVVRVDEESGAKTEYHLLETEHDAQYNKFPGSDGEFVKGYYHNEKTGRLIAIVSDVRSKYADGDVNENYFAALAPASYGDVTESNLAKNYKKITVAEASKLWQEQLNSLPKTIKKPLHLITGTLLPIWDRLPNSHVKIMRAKTDSGKVLLGRTIHPKAIGKVLKSLGVGGNTYSSAEAVAEILENGDEAELANGWKLKRKTVSGEKRIEIVGPDIGNREELDIAGVFSERIQYQTRFFIPKDKAVEVIEKLTKNRPITGLGAPTQGSDPLYSAEYLVAKYTAKAVRAGYNFLRNGLTRFADWAKAMLKQFGKAIGPKLRAMFADLTAVLKSRSGAIGGKRPAGSVPKSFVIQSKDLQWVKDNKKQLRLVYNGQTVATLERQKPGGWRWPEANKAWARNELADAKATVKSTIFEELKRAERESAKYKAEADKRQKAEEARNKKHDDYFTQPISTAPAKPKLAFKERIKNFIVKAGDVLVDRWGPALRLQQKIAKEAGINEISEGENFYRKLELLTNRISSRTEQFKAELFEPIIDYLNKNKISYEQFNRFLRIMHAEERNNHVFEINPEFRRRAAIDPDNPNYAGSGITTREARAEIERMKQDGTYDTYLAAGKMYWDLNKTLLNMQVKYGLMAPKVRDTLNSKYQYYAPLKSMTEDSTKLDWRALGRRSESSDQLAHTEKAIEATFSYGENARVRRAFARFAINHPMPGLYEINRAVKKPYFDENTGEVKYRLDQYEKREELLFVPTSTGGLVMRIKDPALLAVLKNQNDLQLGDFPGPYLRSLNRFLGAVNTSVNPEFMFVNLLRDIQTAAISLSAEESSEMAANVVLGIPRAAITAYEFKAGKNNADVALYKEFMRQGGKIGYRDIYKLEDAAEKLKARMAETQANGAWFQTKEGMKAVRDLIVDANDVIESTTRFSAYKEARKMGMSKEKSGSIAANVTLNFQKRGTAGQILNAMYLFSTASIGGSARVAAVTAKAATSKTGKALIGGAIAFGFMTDIINRILSDLDPDDERKYWDKISAGEKDMNYMIMLPGQKDNPLKIPMPHGFNVFPAIGRNISAMLFGEQTAYESVGNVVNTMRNAFSPVGIDERGAVYSLIPTAIGGPLDVMLGKKWTGKRVRPDQPQFGAETPRSQLINKDTNKLLVVITQALNAIDGDSRRPGTLDFSAADIQYLIEHYLGGAGKTVTRGFDVLWRIGAGQEILPGNVPFVRRFYGSNTDFEAFETFKKNRDEVERYNAAKREDDEAWMQANKWLSVARQRYGETDKRLGDIKKDATLDDDQKRDAMMIEQKRFNRDFEKIRKQYQGTNLPIPEDEESRAKPRKQRKRPASNRRKKSVLFM